MPSVGREIQQAEGRGQKAAAEVGGRKSEDRRQRKEERDYPVGAAFSRDLAIS